MVVEEEERMAKNDDVNDQISLFQRKLEKYANSGETDKVLYYIHKLKYLHVTVKHLEATGVGRTVNSLRHHAGLVGSKARDLVKKWKKMVSAEDSEEEVEEEEEEEDEVDGMEDSTYDRQTDGERNIAVRDQNGDDVEDDEDDDRLQIEEDNEGDNRSIPEYKPGGDSSSYGGGYGGFGDESPGTGNSYNPLTSQMDYQLLNAGAPSGEYHPSSIGGSYSPAGSVEDDINSGWEDASPSVSRDRRNESSSKSSSKKSGREEKEKHKKKDKDRDKERPKDMSGASQEKEKKKDHKHKAKHKERDREEEKKKNKHKDDRHKEKDRQEEKSREKRSEESVEKSREKDKKKYMVNGYEASDAESRSSGGGKHDRDSEKRDSEERRRNKSGSSSNSHRKEERNRDKESVSLESRNRNRDCSDSDREEERVSSKVAKDSVRDKEKSKRHEKHSSAGGSSSSSSKKDKHDIKNHENQREEEEGKKKKSKKSKDEENDFAAALMGFDSPSKKKKKKKKKDRKERDSSDDEQPTSSKSSHKRPLNDSGNAPDAKKPRLLEASPQKLPKLPASITGAALEAPLLPEITPNYKPLPRLPVRDELPNQINSKMTEEETLNIMLQSKSNRRSKMYSGRVTGLQSVPTLYECCIRVMQENIDAIEATGNVPFEILKPVLERATPHQLLNIEDFNPYLLEDTDALWENHCRKDFRNKKLEDMESWRDMWMRCFDEREKKLKSLTENLQQKFISKAEPKRQTKLAFVNVTVKVPKSVARAQAKYGTGTPSGSAVKPGKANEVAARKTAMQNAQRAEKAAAAPRPTAAKNKKVAPLMAKTRQFYKKAFRR